MYVAIGDQIDQSIDFQPCGRETKARRSTSQKCLRRMRPIQSKAHKQNYKQYPKAAPTRPRQSIATHPLHPNCPLLSDRQTCTIENMDELREKLENIRFANTNWEKHHFIPHDTLFGVVSKPAITLDLRSSAVPRHEIIDLTGSILRGARSCLAILVFIRHGEAISSFVRHDSLRSHPDDGMPYNSEALQLIFEEDAASSRVRNFLEKQWEFFVPIMHQHSIDRILNTKTILPFLHEEPAGKGAMGVVSKVKLQCHRLPSQNHEADDAAKSSSLWGRKLFASTVTRG
ncbi:hypothetical protein V8F06_014693 [Rhypophila decipiens]